MSKWIRHLYVYKKSHKFCRWCLNNPRFTQNCVMFIVRSLSTKNEVVAHSAAGSGKKQNNTYSLSCMVCYEVLQPMNKKGCLFCRKR